MNQKIAVMGLTQEQLALLEGAIPERYEMAVAECVTDLILTDAVLVIINTENLEQDNRQLLVDYYTDVEEVVIWIGEQAPLDSILDLLPRLEKVLEQAQERYDYHQICNSEYGALPKHALEECLESIVWNLLHHKYGDKPDSFLAKRARQEWTALLEVDAIPELAAVHELSMWLKRNDVPHYMGGNGTSGFVPFLLGITKVNPLPERYGGYDLVWQEYCSYGRVPSYAFHVPQRTRPQIEIWKKYHWLKLLYPDNWETEYLGEPDAVVCGNIYVFFDAEEAVVPDMSTLCREDIFYYLKKHGFVDKDAFRGMNRARKGMGLPVITEEMRTTEDNYILQQIESVRYAPSRGNLLEQKLFTQQQEKRNVYDRKGMYI